MCLLLDDFLIGEEDMQRLSYVDLVIAGWPRQGHPLHALAKVGTTVIQHKSLS